MDVFRLNEAPVNLILACPQCPVIIGLQVSYQIWVKFGGQEWNRHGKMGMGWSCVL